MKLNADVGESFGVWTMGDDAALMPYIHMANVACGGHASDPLTMHKTVCLAKQYDVQIGAHPSFPDQLGFGRRDIGLSNEEAALHMVSQIGSLKAIAQNESVPITFVKPHGALYNRMMFDDELLRVLLGHMASLEMGIPFMVLGTIDFEFHLKMAQDEGVDLLFEAFADRQYSADGRLLPRSDIGAVLRDPTAIEDRLLHYLETQTLVCVDGSEMHAPIDTFCVHGDNQESIEAVSGLRALVDANQTVLIRRLE